MNRDLWIVYAGLVILAVIIVLLAIIAWYYRSQTCQMFQSVPYLSSAWPSFF